ncbi:MAG TPA: L-lactate permease, partial [Bacillota bacterium]
MNFHPDALRLLLASLPPLTAGALLLRRTAPAWAGLGALAAAVVVLPAFDVAVTDLVGPALSIGPVALEVLGIMYGGLLLFEVLRSGGLHQTLGRWVTSLAPDRPLQVLLVALGVAPFMESVTGFGVGLIMAAPILREMGLSSRQATVVAMLGIVSVPWGALGPGTL